MKTASYGLAHAKLNRYNGDDIQTYKLQKNNPNSLFCNTVSRITGNHNGKIYLLCTEGVAEFNPCHPKIHYVNTRQHQQHLLQ